MKYTHYTKTKRFVYACAFFSLFSCANAEQDATQPSEGRGPMTLQRLLTEQETGFTQPLRLVIRDQEHWKSTWSEALRDRPATTMPTVDFTHFMVIVAAMGTQSTGGHVISIEGVRDDGKSLVVTVRQVSPGPDCMTTQALTSPVDIVQVPKSDTPVTFVEQKEIKNCQ